LNQAGRNCAISGLRARDNVPFSSTGHDECDIAAAIESRIGERDAGLGHCAGDRYDPALRFLQRSLADKQ
jgi:hypothetical protein